MIWFTSDTHFGHKNVIAYCNRPFKDVDHMNLELTRRWNERVEPDDTVYHLGDFAMGPTAKHPEIIKNLHGYKILIAGNHDAPRHKMLARGFNEVHNIGLHAGWTLVHIPLGMSGKILCGHVHCAWKVHKTPELHAINVGVDQWDFYPRTFDELMEAK